MPLVSSGAAAITAGDDYQTCVVTDAGGVLCRREDAFYKASGPLVVVPGLANITSVGVGYQHKCGLRADGQVLCWGYNGSGGLGNGTMIDSFDSPVQVVGLPSPATAIAVGAWTSCAITADDGLWCWGSNSSGNLGIGTTADSPIPVQVPGFEADVIQVAVEGATCAVKSNGDLFCWGWGDHGQIGDGSGMTSTVPRFVMSGVSSVSTGSNNTCALTTAGGVSCWGRNTIGQLGDGTTNDSLLPLPVTNLTAGVVAVKTGYGFSCALLDTGAVSCWGGLGTPLPAPIVQP